MLHLYFPEIVAQVDPCKGLLWVSAENKINNDNNVHNMFINVHNIFKHNVYYVHNKENIIFSDNIFFNKFNFLMRYNFSCVPTIYYSNL